MDAAAGRRWTLGLAFTSFVSIGLPTAALGVAWPTLRVDLDRPLGDRTVATAMGRLLDSPQRELRGLAFAPANDAGDGADAPAFEFRLAKTDRTVGWLSTAGGGEDYTITGMRLDVEPVRMAAPLYRPWRPSAP